MHRSTEQSKPEYDRRDPAEADLAAQRTADLAVKKFFAILGVDIDKPESVEEFREDLRFGRRLRKMTGHGQLAMVAIICGGLVYATWSGIAKALAGPFK